MRVEPHAGAATGVFGGAPNGATKRAKSVPKWNCMRALPLGSSVLLTVSLGLSVGLLCGHKTCEGCEGMQKRRWNCLLPLPLGPSVELRMGPRNV